jgi:Tfp pilus assembly PilM family ATPase
MKTPLPIFSTGIVMGKGYIRLLRLKKIKQEYEVLAMDCENIESQKPEEEAQIQALKRIVRRNRADKEVMCTLSCREVKLVHLFLPLLSSRELSQEIAWHVKKIKPFDIDPDAVMYSYLRVKEKGILKPTQQEIILFCTLEEIISHKVKLLKSAGLKPLGIVPSPLALLNLKHLRKYPAREINVWLHLGREDSFLVIERGGYPIFSKLLSLNSSFLTHQIASSLKVSLSEAEALKNTYGLKLWLPHKSIADFPRENREAKVSYRLASVLENLVVEIEQTIKECSYQFPEASSFKRVFLSGEVAELCNISDFFHSRLGVTIDKLNIFNFFKASEHLTNKFQSLASAFTLCGGLCQQIYYSHETVYFLPPSIKPQPLNYILHPLSIAGIVILGLLIGGQRQLSQIKYYRNNIATLKAKIKDYRQKSAFFNEEQLRLAEEESNLRSIHTEMEEKLKFLSSYPEKKPLSAILADIIALLPRKLILFKTSYEEGKLVIAGYSPGTKEIFSLLDLLRKTTYGRQGKLLYLEKDKRGSVYQFKISMDLELSHNFDKVVN